MNSKITSGVNLSSRRNRWILAGLVFLSAAALLIMRDGGHRSSDSQPQTDALKQVAGESGTSSGRISNTDHLLVSSGINTSPENKSAQDTADDKNLNHSKPSPDGPEVTRATRRDTVVTSSGERKSVVDPMASWQDLPPWPEGPRLFAEVETSNRRYVNLRPDDVGELPRIYAGAEERIELSVNFPEGEPGEKIYVEIPNGGSFPDTDTFGRVFELPSNLMLSFPYVTDDARGYCTVTVRHRGHTRSLPIWIGELPESGS